MRTPDLEKRKQVALLLAQGLKHCNICDKDLPVSHFVKNKLSLTGYAAHCRTCNRTHYQIPHKKEINERVKAWGRANKERIREIEKRYKNQPQVRARRTIKRRLKKIIGPNQTCLRHRELIGCSPKAFNEYLQSRFNELMTWDNYGRYWHIDHIIPCVAFDMTDPQQILQCWNYRNMQPLTGRENVMKGDLLPDGTSASELKERNPDLLRQKVREELSKLGVPLS